MIIRKKSIAESEEDVIINFVDYKGEVLTESNKLIFEKYPAAKEDYEKTLKNRCKKPVISLVDVVKSQEGFALRQVANCFIDSSKATQDDFMLLIDSVFNILIFNDDILYCSTVAIATDNEKLMKKIEKEESLCEEMIEVTIYNEVAGQNASY